MRFTVEEAGGRTVIAGIERPTTDLVLRYAKAAELLGADAVMLTSPFGADVDQHRILEHYRKVHDGCALDIYIYNESSLSRNETAFETLLSIAALPRVVGIKDSAEGGRDAGQIRALQRLGLAYYIGWEHHLGRGLPCDGNVVSLANLEPMLCRIAQASVDPAVVAEIARVSEACSLFSEDWYRHVKKELKARGVIASDRVVSA